MMRSCAHLQFMLIVYTHLSHLGQEAYEPKGRSKGSLDKIIAEHFGTENLSPVDLAWSAAAGQPLRILIDVHNFAIAGSRVLGSVSYSVTPSGSFVDQVSPECFA